MNSWPDGGMTPFRSEKNTKWEGAYRVPAMIRWPGHVKPGRVRNEIFAALDWFPTLLAAAGEPDIKDKLITGYASSGKRSRCISTATTTAVAHQPAGQIGAQGVFLQQRRRRARGDPLRELEGGVLRAEDARHARYVGERFVCRRQPKLFNLRTDPYERAGTTSNIYYDWTLQRAFLFARRRHSSSGSLRRSRAFRRGRSRRASA